MFVSNGSLVTKTPTFPFTPVIVSAFIIAFSTASSTASTVAAKSGSIRPGSCQRIDRSTGRSPR